MLKTLTLSYHFVHLHLTNWLKTTFSQHYHILPLVLMEWKSVCLSSVSPSRVTLIDHVIQFQIQGIQFNQVEVHRYRLKYSMIVLFLVSDVQVTCMKVLDQYIPPMWIMCLESVAHLLVMINFSTNFLIYCSVSKQFKSVLSNILAVCFPGLSATEADQHQVRSEQWISLVWSIGGL